ncbi:4-hydroxy-tetrahydrodipicolinate reductase [Marivirga sp. S37H4]|uniref:4-hydroxy-tetrahydrodipicolinate reductase n=1 Tax=Marivirga aurantiaca TaxID=2802615 RepID=A0A935C706_9BACT|nr:4-hydroxy-tetrahydrodipicolinate reductase [Marivirga aurantiaca]MBK6264731.1 4-hydroxy-tetrahydrodipicolinate reductase [Marivirga aurantiaca]
MKILLIGHGKMGQAIEAYAIQRGHSIVAIVDVQDSITPILTQQADVAIEFTHPDSAFENIKCCLENNLPILSGTTGWLDRKPEIEQICKKNNGTFLYASNFSIGVNLFFKVNRFLAKIMQQHDQYSPSMVEVHHTHKKDAPSGTAITLAEGIIAENKNIKSWTNQKTENSGELPIVSERIGEIPGTHKVTYQSEVDQISIEHEAYSRDGFVQGAVLVAEWLPAQKGVVKIDDFLKL